MTVGLVLRISLPDEVAAERLIEWYAGTDRFASEDSTLVYALNQADPTTFLVYEVFSDDEGFSAHITAPLAGQFRDLLKSLGGRAEPMRCTPLWAKGIAVAEPTASGESSN
jgi:quinol monooxygenase YgiN